MHLQQAMQSPESLQIWHQFVADALGAGTASAAPMRKTTNKSLRDFLMVLSLNRE